ncbi:MAG: NAD-dependent epimerase/dehydratase family protein [Chloroflexota bacterium]
MASFLVTGGAGFIGSHIVQYLLQNNQQVRVLDNFSTGKKENLQGFFKDLEIIEGDLRDPSAVYRAVQNIDIIFHEAAFVSATQSMVEPKTCYDVNVGGTENLLEEARKAGVERIILASSAAVYGESEAIPLSEDHKTQPISPYAASKVINEIYADMYTRSFGIEVVVLRYFNVFGPQQAPDSQYAAAIPNFIRSFLSNDVITIFGDGNQTRDLIFVQDVVRANLLAAETPGAAGNIFNICSGIETSIQQLVDILQELFPEVISTRYLPPRTGDIYRSVGNPALAKEKLSFQSQTSIYQGLSQTVEWMRTCNK